MPIQTSDNKFSTAKFIVNPTAGLGTHTTITAACAAASSGDYILITQATYTENFTLPAGLTISGMPGAADTPSTIVNGTITFTATGSASISNLQLKTNSANCLVVSGSNACILTIDNCDIVCSNNTGISFTNSNASSQINVYDTSGDITTTGIALYTMSGTNAAALLYFQGCVFTNTGNSITPSNNSSGNVQFLFSETSSPLSTSGSSGANLTGFQAYFFINNLAVAVIASNSTTQSTLHSCAVNNANNTIAPLTVGAGSILAVLNSSVLTSDTNWVSGTGTIGYGAVTVPGTGTIDGALTAVAINTFVGTVKP